MWLCLIFICAAQGYRIEITTQPKSRAVLLGRDFLLDCEALLVGDAGKSFNESYFIEYAWLYNNNSAFSNNDKTSLLSNHSLYIRSAVVANLGSYQCVAAFNGSQEFSNIATVVNAYTEQFDKDPQSQNVISGSQVTFSCISGYSAPPAVISWLKNGFLFENGELELDNYGNEKNGGAFRRVSNLTFISTYDSGGNYQCLATNPLSLKVVLSSAAFLNNSIIPIIPALIKPLPELLIVAEGRSFYLDCLMTGWPPPSIYWQINKTRIFNDSRWTSWSNGTLLLKSVTRSESSGSYVCTGQNSEGVISPKGVTIMISYLDAIFIEEPSSKVSLFGGKLSFACIPPHSYPEANISWFMNEKPLTLRPELNVQNRNNISFLEINKVLYTDAGFYSCRASNALAPNTLRVSRSAELTVEGIPEIIQPPVSKNVVWKNILWLECRARSNPQPSVTWYKDSKMLIESQKILTSESNQYLTVLNFNQEDVGKYSCKATNQYGTTSSTEAFISLIVPPEIATSLENTTCLEHQSLLLPCKFYSQPTNSSYWFKNEIPLSSGRYVVRSDGLFFGSSTWEDSGFYKCCSSNQAGTRCQSAYLDVLVSPLLTNMSSDVKVDMPENIQIFCCATGNPAPQITWFFNNKEFKTLLLGIITETTGNCSTLKIFNSYAQQSGQYSCLAKNRVGSISRSTNIFVREKPRIVPLPSSVEVISGQNLMLNCSIQTGNPPPVVVWLKNNSIIQPTQDLRIVDVGNWSILLKFVSSEDEGKYVCVARNEAGEDSSGTLVIVAVPPSTPSNVFIASISTSSINITWNSPIETRNSPVDYYVLQCKREYLNSFQTNSNSIPKYRLWFEVSNLASGTFYWLRVAGRNKAGLGSFTSPIGTSTALSSPSEPRNVMILQVTSISATILWEIPSQQYAAVTSYQVQYRSKYPAGSDFTTVEVTAGSGPQQMMNLSSLESLTTYECRVRAMTSTSNQHLLGPFSDSLFFTTLLSSPKRCPIDLKIYLNSSSLLYLTWEVPQDTKGNDPISGFRMQFESLKLLTHSSVTVNYTRQKMSWYLDNLRPWSEYLIKLFPFNEAGDGKCSLEKSFETPPIPPTGPPLNVQIQIVDPTSIMVTWQEIPPVERTCEISSYYVSCISDEEAKNIQTNKRMLFISGLSEEVKYVIKIRAFCERVGFGPFSDPVVVKVPGRASTTTATSTTSRIQPTTQFTPTATKSTIRSSTSNFHSSSSAAYSTPLMSTIRYENNQDNIVVIVGASVGGAALLVVLIIFSICCWCQRNQKSYENQKYKEKLFRLHPFVESDDLWHTTTGGHVYQKNDLNARSSWNI